MSVKTNHLSAHHLIMKCAGTQLVHTSVNVNKDIIMSVACVKVQTSASLCAVQTCILCFI